MGCGETAPEATLPLKSVAVGAVEGADAAVGSVCATDWVTCESASRMSAAKAQEKTGPPFNCFDEIKSI